MLQPQTQLAPRTTRNVTNLSLETDMDGDHFLKSFGCFNRKQTEEYGRFGAEI